MVLFLQNSYFRIHAFLLFYLYEHKQKNVRSVHFCLERWLCIFTQIINNVWNKIKCLGLYRLSNHAEMKNSTNKHRITTIVIFWLLLFLFEGTANIFYNICITNPAFQWYCFQKVFFFDDCPKFCHFTSHNIKDNVSIIICIIINLNFCTFCSIPFIFGFWIQSCKTLFFSTYCKTKIYLWDGAMHKIFKITHPFLT